MKKTYVQLDAIAIQSYIFKTLLRKPQLLVHLLKLASLGKRTGLSGLVQVLRILGWYGKNIANAEGLLATIPKTFLREHLENMPLVPEKPKGKQLLAASHGPGKRSCERGTL